MYEFDGGVLQSIPQLFNWGLLHPSLPRCCGALIFRHNVERSDLSSALLRSAKFFFGEEHNIARVGKSVATEKLAGDAFNPVSLNRKAHMFFSNDYSQSRVFGVGN